MSDVAKWLRNFEEAYKGKYVKPCPFCGAEYTKDSEDYWYSAKHEDWCLLGKNPADGMNFIFAESDVDAWNRRW